MRAAGVIIGLWIAVVSPANADEPVVTMLTGFEDPSVAASIGEVRNIAAGDCAARLHSRPPTRDRGSLAIDIGATRADVSVVCDLVFREATRFGQIDRLSTYCWIDEGTVELAFRVRDARQQVFETPPQLVDLDRRWTQVSVAFDAGKLRRVRGDGKLVYPIEVQGYRVTTDRLGRQTVWLDDLRVEHHVAPRETIRGGFVLDEPTRIYEPGSRVSATVVMENKSRTRGLDLSVDLAWLRPDGTTLKTQRGRVNLPHRIESRIDRKIDFSQVVREPGLYRLVARVRAAGWSAPNVFETTIAVTPSNRGLARGRSTFFGMRTNLLREPETDQALEIEVARDIGVNLLVIETPWARIEPKSGEFDYDRLDSLVDALVARNMAPMLVVTGTPGWLDAAESREAVLTRLLLELAEHFGPRLQRFQIGSAALSADRVPAGLEAVRRIRETLGKRHPDILLLPPAIDVTDVSHAREVAALVAVSPEMPVVFQSSGDTKTALRMLERYRMAGGFAWRPSHWWQHRSPSLPDAGGQRDAESVLRHYVEAALSGVAGLIWQDLRDDDNDPAQPALQCGLVRRDFSPKAPLVGFAAAAGQLTGYSCFGPTADVPDGHVSGLYVGGGRQVAVVFSEPNRVLPAVLAPSHSIPGFVDVYDFERRLHPMLDSGWPMLVPTDTHPLFVLLELHEAQPEPVLTLARPWLRVPKTVFCGEDTGFSIEVDIVKPLRSGYLALRVPPDAPYTASVSAIGLEGEPGDTITEDVRLTPNKGAAFEKAELVLRVSLDGDTFDVPIEVRPRVLVPRLSRRRGILDARYLLAEDVGGRSDGADASVRLQCAYTPTEMHLAAMIDGTRRATGDRLLVGMALENADHHIEVSVDVEKGELKPLRGTTPEGITGWTCRCERDDAGRLTCVLVAPVGTLGADRLGQGRHMLLSVHYENHGDADQPVRVHRWGGGLDGSCSSAEFRWIELVRRR